MRKFAILSLGLCALALTSLTVLVSAGRQQPVNPLLESLRLSDCELPCWIGIVPGQTKIEMARERIKTLFGQSDYIKAEVAVSTSPGQVPTWRIASSSSPVVIHLSAVDGETVDTIDFSFDNGQVTVADLYRVLGSPSRMARWRQNFPYFVMAYGTDERGLMTFSDLSDSFRWTQPVKAMVLYANGQSPTPSNDLIPWFGFHTLRSYFDRMP